MSAKKTNRNIIASVRFDVPINQYPEDGPNRTASAGINANELTRFIMKLFSYAVLLLFVVSDGLNNPDSFETKFLTLPYLIGGLSLTRSICEALDSHHDFHAGLFAFGLSTLSALA